MSTYPKFLGVFKPHLVKSANQELELRLEMMAKACWPKKMECPTAKRIVVIAPHPDDETIGCGGFLLKHKGQSEIKIINIFNGDGGGALEEGPWENTVAYKKKLVEVRKAELDIAAKELGANQVIRLGVSDCEPVISDKEFDAIRKEFSDFQPDLVLVPWLFDKHPHHQMACDMVTKACKGMDFMTLSYEVWGLLAMNAFCDVSEQSPVKKKILENYKSQLKTVDYLSYVDGLEKTRAFMAPVNNQRNGAVEAYFSLPSKDLFDLVQKKLNK